MRATIAFLVVALLQGACGFVFPGQIPATPAGVFRRIDSGSLFKRQEVCDPVSGCTYFCFHYVSTLGAIGYVADIGCPLVSCRTGEYCVIIDGSVGCCPEG